MLNFSRCARVLALTLSAFVIFLAAVSSAEAQDFTMQPVQTFSPPSVEPGGSAVATFSVSPLNGFTGSVALSCAVTSSQTTNLPVCAVSPATTTPPSSPSLTFTALSSTSPGSYTVTVTGTGGSTTQQLSLNIAVLTVTSAYTLTVTGVVTPGTLHAGSGATAIITVTPVNNYTSPAPGVTLSCSAITPAVKLSPVCSFDPPQVMLSGPTAQTSTLTITTTGPAPKASVSSFSYAAWLPLGAFAIMAARFPRSGKLRRRILGLSVLGLIATALFFMPACGNSYKATTTSNGNVTPNNTYSFTINASDPNSIAPSNTPPSVSLTVN